ncbi:Nn.00g055780.m01.CDS01 [Neocucurbitaria sp. VM-36]
MAEPSPNPESQATETEPVQVNGLDAQGADVVMADSSALHQQLSPNPNSTPLPQPPSLQPTVSTQPPTPQAAQTPTPAPPATAPAPAPAPAVTSSRNSPHPTQQAAPTQPIPHGSPTRVYLNQHVTPHLLEAMKHLATTEPDKPLKWLSEFLAVKSAEIEGP